MRELLLIHFAALFAGLTLDWIIGDPHSLPHPIRAIGSLIAALEARLLGRERAEDKPRDPVRERRRGTLLWITVVFVSVAVTAALVVLAWIIHPALFFVTETILDCYMLAAGSLCRESLLVTDKLEGEGVPAARRALSMIVGRDTADLPEPAIVLAAAETVAENTCDGVIAPLFYAALGGPVLGYAYKAVNTMDSMLGYRNEKYEHFGRTAARMDDVFNWLPARISALFMIAAAFLAGQFSKSFDGKRAFRIWKRDRRNHASPNSAQTESVCAGALGLEMGGTHLYGGIPVEKPTIGDRMREAERADVLRANTLMAVTEALLALFLALIALLLVLFAG
ncbi:MAG: adenosylcobinamide-phosphate synthase CbiB [Lachnospiraceae bacterium]|nr:adenosylcobinamide-phosphate synthase CbiB [Lachnospiraceae bacterium]